MGIASLSRLGLLLAPVLSLVAAYELQIVGNAWGPYTDEKHAFEISTDNSNRVEVSDYGYYKCARPPCDTTRFVCVKFDLAQGSVDPKCKGVSVGGIKCGIHIHAGTSCKDGGVGDRYFSEVSDPWIGLGYSGPRGSASADEGRGSSFWRKRGEHPVVWKTGMVSGEVCANIGNKSIYDLAGRTVVVAHDFTGKKIACGVPVFVSPRCEEVKTETSPGRYALIVKTFCGDGPLPYGYKLGGWNGNHSWRPKYPERSLSECKYALQFWKGVSDEAKGNFRPFGMKGLCGLPAPVIVECDAECADAQAKAAAEKAARERLAAKKAAAEKAIADKAAAEVNLAWCIDGCFADRLCNAAHRGGRGRRKCRRTCRHYCRK